MKKNLFMMAAVMFGILLAFTSCKDSKKGSKADDKDDTEQVEKDGKTATMKDAALKKVASLEDIEALSEMDLDDLDISELDMDDIDLEGLDLSELTESQANALLELVMLVGNKELPQEAGDGMTMSAIDVDDEDVTFLLEVAPNALGGVSIEQFDEVINNADIKDMMIQQMIESFESGDEDMKTFFKVITTANKNLNIKFKEEGSDKEANLTITSDQLKQIQNQ